jgi:hypothetical protein
MRVFRECKLVTLEGQWKVAKSGETNFYFQIAACKGPTSHNSHKKPYYDANDRG